MAAMKRRKTGKPAARKATARAKSAPRAAKVRPAKAALKAKAKAKPTAKARPAAAAKAPAAAETALVASLKARFQRERGALERRLTETVREIGVLRHHELRATQLERQLQERDALIAKLRAELSDLQAQPAVASAPRAHEEQPSLAFGSVARDLDALDDAGALDDDEEHQLI